MATEKAPGAMIWRQSTCGFEFRAIQDFKLTASNWTHLQLGEIAGLDFLGISSLS
jgi:hypothetical protein